MGNYRGECVVLKVLRLFVTNENAKRVHWVRRYFEFPLPSLSSSHRLPPFILYFILRPLLISTINCKMVGTLTPDFNS
jgi:hypothetical protein